jgi:hypothetical protein
LLFFLPFFLCLSFSFYFFAQKRRVIYYRLLKTHLRAGIWTGKVVTTFYSIPYSLTTLEHSVQGEILLCSSRPSSTPPPMSIPLHPPKCPSEGDICHKVPRIMSCPGSLCPGRHSHTSLTMVICIWSSSYDLSGSL